ncbi:MAG: hypothetical protein K0R24_343 [Gammaproteobacteria bacterium]|jgi:conjugal transfer ATP-binding protein TraC|nr:hypothetical protein [Gammaproteobacteria bacterium]
MWDYFSEMRHKLAGWLGDKTYFGVNTLPKSRNALIDEKMDSTALSRLLPYESYDPETGIFINKKSQGFILEALPLLGANEEIVAILTSIFTDILPAQTDIQFILWGSDKVGELLSRFEEERSGKGEIFEWLAKKRSEFLKKGVYQSLTSQGSFILRDFRLFIAISLPRKVHDRFTHDLMTVRDDIVSSLKSMQMPTKNILVKEFISLLSDLLHPSSDIYSSQSEWNPYDSLSTQLDNPEYCLRVFKDKLQFENLEGKWEARCLSIKDYPSHIAQWKMTDSIGQLFNHSLQIPCSFVTALSLRVIDHSKSAMQSQFTYLNKEKSVKSPLAKFMPLIGKEFQEWSYIRDRLAEGDRLVQTHFQVILFSKENEASVHERKIRDLYRANGWRLKKTAYLQLQSFLSVLPMMMSEGLWHDMNVLGRLRTMTAFNAANIAPLQGEWKGSRTPRLILPGRRGQIAVFSPFDNAEGNYNVAIAAASGRGKSVLTQEYIVSLLSSGGRVWVIDIGRSYEKTCKMLGGSFIEFSTDFSISLNPFTHIKDFDASLSMLKPLLAAMAHPTSSASDAEITFIEKGLKAAWQARGCHATITTVAKWLEHQDSAVCKNLSHLLYSYTCEGMYGRYFEGDSTIDLSNTFVVLELQELKAKRDLQRIVMLVLMYHISEVMYLGERQQNKSCIIDEAWDLFGGDNDGAAQFIETGYRTARRYNANFLTIVQSINDYFKNSTTIAAFENSDTKMILGQTSEAIDQLKKSERLTIDPFTEKLLKSLRKTDEYSECVIKTPSGVSVHRIILDPYSRILYSSKGEEFEAVKTLQAEGYSLMHAVEIVARKFSHENK